VRALAAETLTLARTISDLANAPLSRSSGANPGYNNALPGLPIHAIENCDVIVTR
jgi:hypothetical protein